MNTNDNAKQMLEKLQREQAQLHHSILNYAGDTQSQDFLTKTERYREVTEEINKLKELI